MLRERECELTRVRNEADGFRTSYNAIRDSELRLEQEVQEADKYASTVELDNRRIADDLNRYATGNYEGSPMRR